MKEIMELFRQADDWRRQYDEKAIECYKLYTGYREPLPEEKIGRSNLHIPRMYEEIDAIRARLIKSFFASRPYIDFIPVPSQPSEIGPDGQVVEKLRINAQIASNLVDFQLEKNDIYLKIYNFITSFLIFPAAILSVGWKHSTKKIKRRVPIEGLDILSRIIAMITGIQPMETIEEEVVTWDDNEITNVDYFDFWPDPESTTIQDSRFVFQREWMTRKALDELLDMLKETDAGKVTRPDYEKLAETEYIEESGRWQKLSSVGFAPDTGTKRGLYEVLHYWEDERHAIIINRREKVFEGSNPYWRHCEKPFVVASFEPMPNEFYGKSGAEFLIDLQHELNTLRNQRIDNVSFVLNRMWVVRRSADIDESQLVSRPHGIIEVDTIDDIKELTMSDITSSSYNEEAVIKQDMENALGVPGVVRGANTTKRETATEVVTKTSNASIRFDIKIMLFEMLGIKRLAYLMDCNNQQFIDTPRLINMYSPDGIYSWQEIKPGELVGEYDYRPAASNIDPAANKEIRRGQIMQLVGMAAQTGMPYFDMYELVKTLVETLDLRNTHKLLVSKEELIQQQMAAQSQQQQIAMQGATPEQAVQGQMLGGI